jgi:hypothetical protein
VPTRIVVMDFDNGSEFLNWCVIAWTDKHGIPVTRGRPNQHNNNAHIEQRNGDGSASTPSGTGAKPMPRWRC